MVLAIIFQKKSGCVPQRVRARSLPLAVHCFQRQNTAGMQARRTKKPNLILINFRKLSLSHFFEWQNAMFCVASASVVVPGARVLPKVTT